MRTRTLSLIIAVFLLGAVAPWGADIARADRSPLPAEDLPGLYQRILTLPGAVLHARPDAGAGEPLPVFSVLYVYDRRSVGGVDWLEVGRSSLGESDGFIRQDKAEDWRHMLVMRFAPRGVRDRVMFFRDKATLSDLAASIRNQRFVNQLEAGIVEGEPDTGILVAVEPATFVKYEDQPYLFPVLDFLDVRTGARNWTTLVNIAGLNAVSRDSTNPFDQKGVGQIQPAFQDMRHAVVFVVDTTRSMQSYLDRIHAAIGEIYSAFERAGGIDKVTFGLIAYRDNIGPNPQIGYVTDVPLPLRLGTSPSEILETIGRVDVSPVSTKGWDEDAFAGLNEALKSMDWSGFNSRLVILVTDAGARSGNDPLAKFPGLDVQALAEEADAKRIAVFALHLETEEARQAGNFAKAQRQYRALGRTGDGGTEKYVAIPARPLEAFTDAMQAFGDAVVDAAESAASGRFADTSRKGSDGGLGLYEMVVNEIFRSQLEFLGERQKTKAPGFYRAWASDHDLVKPDLQSLEVSVFLTRTQLNALGSRLGQILEVAKEGRTSAQQFFERLQDLATRTSYDPQRGQWTRDQTLAEAGLLPAYLAKLPYRSDVLNLSETTWLSLGQTGQQEFIDNLDFKLTAYENIATFDSWVDLGAGEKGLEVYPMPLSLLP